MDNTDDIFNQIINEEKDRRNKRNEKSKANRRIEYQTEQIKSNKIINKWFKNKEQSDMNLK